MFEIESPVAGQVLMRGRLDALEAPKAEAFLDALKGERSGDRNEPVIDLAFEVVQPVHPGNQQAEYLMSIPDDGGQVDN